MDSRQIIVSPLTGIQFLDAWSDPDRLIADQGTHLSSLLQDLLTWRGSLTQRLENRMGKKVELQLISHDHVHSWPDDGDVWKGSDAFDPDTAMLVRNAWLVLGGNRLVFAHSQIVIDNLPESDYHSIKAGNQALGYLFIANNGQLTRKDLQLNRILLSDSPLFSDFRTMNPCWCRRSLFHVNDVLLARIIEIFPPVIRSY
ncbi:MAG: chorismate lyase [Magnetococcales bacterium]|nr:chorismate lyase [Magnetococcales bacterium]MBF0152024.1 chorismate lyase [Magnetococcales bacterium]